MRVFFVMAFFFVFSGLTPKKDQADIIDMVERNVQAMNNKNIEVYMQDVYPTP